MHTYFTIQIWTIFLFFHLQEQRRYKKLYNKLEAGRVQGSLQGFSDDAAPPAVPSQDDSQAMDLADDKHNTTS